MECLYLLTQLCFNSECIVMSLISYVMSILNKEFFRLSHEVVTCDGDHLLDYVMRDILVMQRLRVVLPRVYKRAFRRVSVPRKYK